ncbi:uncharacterized protein LOC126780413 isoform X2 [Nymphalis io]|nr:uncharacterized protein LOC126780413 isoform X2 [Nymphalis io]
MSVESGHEVSVQPESNGESPPSPEEGSAPPTDDMSRYSYDKIVAEAIADNLYNVSVELGLEDEYGGLSLYASSRGPPLPFVFNEYLRREAEEYDIDYKISKIEGLESMVVNSPSWYDRVKPHLTVLEREELWERAPWAAKFFWNDFEFFWNDEDDTFNPPLYAHYYYIPVF